MNQLIIYTNNNPQDIVKYLNILNYVLNKYLNFINYINIYF